ncbi:MAG: tetratricopeptide repeat protein [Deltaproteobacteria bacterium]|nr:tetratricopeptide repeat protein [Deltaproteobacteria bacterium]
MQVSCIHCSHRFDHEVPSFAQPGGSTVCPSCGRDTPAEEVWGGDSGLNIVGGTDNRVYCFNCGKGMTPQEGELIPVCDECRAEQGGPVPGAGLEPEPDEPVADWMIRKANGNVYGPFPSETIVEWVHARKINADEEVAHIGGAWRLFGSHEEFGSYFEKPKSAPPVGAPTDLDFRRKTPIRDALGRFGVAGIALLLIGGIGFGVWYAVSNHALVLPESTLERVVERVGDLSASNQASSPSMSPDARNLLMTLLEQNRGATGNSMELFLRGRTLMLRDNYGNLVQARKELEKAVALDPSNVLALTGLSEVYNLLAWSGYDTLDLQRQAIYLIQMAESDGNYPAATLRSKAAFLIYSGNYAEGRGIALEALGKNAADPSLHYLLGIAAMAGGEEVTDEVQGHFDKAIELDPKFHQVWYALARAEEASGHLGKAVAYYKKKIATDAASSASHTRLGHIFRSVGRYKTAISHYDSAIALNKREKEAFLSRGVLAYQVEGNPQKAVMLFEKLLVADGPELRIAERKEIGTHLSAAYRLSGNPQKAITAADEVIKKDRTYGAAHFQRGLALVAAGRPQDAMPEFSKAEDSGLEPNELARVLFYSGHAAYKAGRLQEAAEAFQRGLDTDSSYTPLSLWAAKVKGEMGDVKLAATSLMDHIKDDPLDYVRDRNVGDWWAPVPSAQPVADVFLKALEGENFAPELNAAVGVALFHAGKDEKADAFLKAAVEQDPRAGGALFYQGLIAHKKGRASAAVNYFREVMGVVNSSGVLYVYLADALLSSGKVDEALGSFERGMAYGGKGAWSLTRQAAALTKAGRDDDAREKLDEALDGDPKAILPKRAKYDIPS